MQITCVYYRSSNLVRFLQRGLWVGLCLSIGLLRAQNSAATTTPDPASPLRPSILDQGLNQPVLLDTVTVVGHLDEARQQIVPSTGATVYSVTQEQIRNQSQGDNLPFNKLLLRFPGVSQDDAGDGNYHIRDEHANVQYRINDVLIPEGITGFGSEFDTRFADRVDLITGALPSQYGFRTSGIVDIHTKSGSLDQGGEVELNGGSQWGAHLFLLIGLHLTLPSSKM